MFWGLGFIAPFLGGMRDRSVADLASQLLVAVQHLMPLARVVDVVIVRMAAGLPSHTSSAWLMSRQRYLLSEMALKTCHFRDSGAKRHLSIMSTQSCYSSHLGQGRFSLGRFSASTAPSRMQSPDDMPYLSE